MNGNPSSPLGVCILPPQAQNAAQTTRYAAYTHEILRHAGVCYTPVAWDALADALPHLRLLLTVGEAAMPEPLPQRLREWVQAGGAWVSSAGLCGAEDLFGAESVPPSYLGWGVDQATLGEGYLCADSEPHPITGGLRIPLHFFNGLCVRPTHARRLAHVLDAHHRPTSHAALLEAQHGKGRCLLIAPDIPGSLVHIQQGVAVTRDGIPSPDGTAPISDAVLKSDDGMTLDWLLDRQPVEELPGLSAFLEPIADQWRELLLRALFHVATEQEVALPLLWFYPRNLPAIAHLSHDTDGNLVSNAELLLQLLHSAQIRSTWCTIPPGYPPEIIAAIRESGHELAMHFDSLDHPWTEAEFDAQWRQLTALFGGEKPITNKNHYLRWEGDTEFFDWCTRRDIQLDQSKGVSKMGEAGFIFGTCHPYFPFAPEGRMIDVLELPTPTQDLNSFLPAIFGKRLLDAVKRHYGVLHLLFHPARLTMDGVSAALLEIVAHAKQEGLEWWTAWELNAWERARRRIQWSEYRQTADGAAVCLRAEEPLCDVTVLWLSPAATRLQVNGAEHPMQTVTRWGFRFYAAAFDVAPDTGYTLHIRD